MKWQCANGHIWEAIPSSIVGGHWCPKCAGNKPLDIAEMQILAISKGGKCLSKKYTNSNTKLLWQCIKNHTWEARPGQIKMGHWCPACSGNQPHTISDMNRIALLRGGKCLSTEYINGTTKMLWRCSNGHVWRATPRSVLHNHWCHYCTSHTGEEITRVIFERMFDVKFPKAKPVWLLNDRGNSMELDGFCDKLRIGFEYQGEQHYKNVKIFTNYDITIRSVDDLLKEKLCKENGIILIHIPYYIEYTDLQDFIITECQKKHIEIPNTRKVHLIDLGNFNPRDLQELKKLAKSKGGMCLSNSYFNGTTKLKWQCVKGHVWEARPFNIKQGSWCPVCWGRQKLKIEDMKVLAAKRGGKCLSKKYVNSEYKLTWGCSVGHKWDTTPHNIQKGRWCPICANRKPSNIKKMKELARSRNGICVSKKYVNTNTKLIWQCAKGHKWQAPPVRIKRGHWCPKCAIKKSRRRSGLFLNYLK